MNQPYTYRYPLPFGLPSHLGYHSAPGELPVLYSAFPSAVHFIQSISSVYVSIPVSHFLPPHPFPHWCPYICSLRLCLYFCFAAKITSTIFLDSTYICVIIRHLFFSFWLTSLCMTDSNSIHVSTNDPVSFLFAAQVLLNQTGKGE